MKELSFAQNFSMIALNSQDSLHMTNAKKVSLRCIAAATILELYMENRFTKHGDLLTFNQEDTSHGQYQQTILQLLFRESEALQHPLAAFLVKVTKLSNKNLKEVERSFASSLKEADAMEEIPALLGCDLEYVTADIQMKEYHSHPELYTRVTESLRAEILEDGAMTDEAILMLWLLRESDCIYNLFSREEMKRVAARTNEVFESNALAKQIFPIHIHKSTETIIKNFLRMKKEVLTTPIGSGITFVFPNIERSEAIFIETEEIFANEHNRLHDVKARLEMNGHSFTVIREGKVPLIKIDNVYYEAVPSIKQFQSIPVHGVRLRKYPLTL